RNSTKAMTRFRSKRTRMRSRYLKPMPKWRQRRLEEVGGGHSAPSQAASRDGSEVEIGTTARKKTAQRPALSRRSCAIARHSPEAVTQEWNQSACHGLKA